MFQHIAPRLLRVFVRLARSAAGNLPTFPASGGRNGRHTVYKPQYRLQ
ncbi:hypothetical protein H8A11_06640 [Neisseria meningitidis]|nr:hypothetical protein [Neisseria meningitidis]MBJ1819202.1 hypothetical protein [Neisseria meningitidis]MBJ7751561.1 hypothetical protein [Neisseria meningitidis]MBJ7791413.1 hypothetical protein [Neisseria meningitidis]MBJ7865697.1 hypothetical protein [Neisseria meningitidis]